MDAGLQMVVAWGDMKEQEQVGLSAFRRRISRNGCPCHQRDLASYSLQLKAAALCVAAQGREIVVRHALRTGKTMSFLTD